MSGEALGLPTDFQVTLGESQRHRSWHFSASYEIPDEPCWCSSLSAVSQKPLWVFKMVTPGAVGTEIREEAKRPHQQWLRSCSWSVSISQSCGPLSPKNDEATPIFIKWSHVSNMLTGI